MAIDNSKVEACIKAFKEDKNQKNINEMIEAVRVAQFFLPARVPEGMTFEEMQAKGMQPTFGILNNGDNGNKFLPIYTKPEEIPEGQKGQLLAAMGFTGCYNFVLNQPVEMTGIVINPFTDNVILPKDLLEQIKDVDIALSKEKKTAHEEEEKKRKLIGIYVDTVLGLQKKLLIPRIFESEGNFLKELAEDKEKALVQLYQDGFDGEYACPYNESNFNVMALQIDEQTKVLNVDLPKRYRGEGIYERMIIVNKEGKVSLFCTVCGDEPKIKNLVEVDAQGNEKVVQEQIGDGDELHQVMEYM
ncbi:MAG: SseB family protein [Lachnospiraceae bacterium]|nr:SseB family protein [Lachnospiraceae bacterium]